MKLRLISLFVAGLVLQSCTSGGSEDSMIRVSLDEEVKSLDPANTYDGVSLSVLPSVVESLYQYDYYAETVKVEPLLAEGMPEFSKDGKTVVVKIRKGIFYAKDTAFGAAGTRELNANDFIYAVKRLAHPGVQSQGRWIFDDRLVGFSDLAKRLAALPKEKVAAEFDAATLPGVKAIDSHTLEFDFLKPYPQFLYILTMSFVAPVPPEAIAKYGDANGQMNDHMVGTGPFRLKEWQRRFKITLERNPDFRNEVYPLAAGELAGKKMPALEGIEFLVMQEEQPRWLTFMKGKLDFIRIPKDNYALAIHDGNLTQELVDKGIRLSKVRPTSIFYLTLNVKDPILSNQKLRQALNAAVDRSKWLKLFTNDRGTEMQVLAPPGLLDRPDEMKFPYTYNVEKAKSLLAQAGYPGGKGLPALQIDFGGTDTATRQLSEFFVEQFAQIGVKAIAVLNTLPAIIEKQKTGQTQICSTSWGLDYPDVENIYQLLSVGSQPPGYNTGFYGHPKVNADYLKLATMLPGPERAKIVREIETVVQEDCPWITGYYIGEHTLSQSWVLNHHPNPLINSAYKHLGVDRTSKKVFLAKRK